MQADARRGSACRECAEETFKVLEHKEAESCAHWHVLHTEICLQVMYRGGLSVHESSLKPIISVLMKEVEAEVLVKIFRGYRLHIYSN